MSNGPRITRARKDKDHPYKPLLRATFDGSKLSFEARGLLAYILMKPDDWYVDINDIRREGGIGRDQAYRILNELLSEGYAERTELRDETGRFDGYEIRVYESPPSDHPNPESQESDKADYNKEVIVLSKKKDEEAQEAVLHQRQPQIPPSQQAQEKVSDPTALQSSDVIDYYRVNIVGKKTLTPAQEEQVFHLCLKFGNLILLEAMKNAVSGNSKSGIPTLNFIAAIAKRLQVEADIAKVRLDAIARSEGDEATPDLSEDPQYFLKNDGLDAYRKLLSKPQESGDNDE